ERSVEPQVCEPAPAFGDALGEEVEVAEVVEHARAPLERLPDLFAHGPHPALHALDRLGLLHRAPQRLLAARAAAAPARERLHEVVDERDRLLGGRARLSQTRLAQKRGPPRARLLERRLARDFRERVSLFVDAADAFERERDAPPVLAHAGQSVAAALRDEDEAAAAATDADDATGHDLTVEPAHEGLCARVRRAFQEARARARQALQPARDFRGQVAVAFGELRTQAPLGLGARPFEAREFFGGVAARE